MDSPLFLTEEQITGNNQLEILRRYGTKCATTDFAILLGCSLYDDDYIKEYNIKKYRNCPWLIQSLSKNKMYFVVGNDSGSVSFWSGMDYHRNIGARPALPYSLIQSFSSRKIRDINRIKEFFYGEYPQTIVDENYSYELENIYENGNLKTTGKNYTTDSVRHQDHDTSFKARTYIEYEYSGSKYIRFIADSNYDGEALSDVLSDGRKIQTGNIYWVKVEPITWLLDEEENIALSKKILFAGVRFKDIKYFMDKFFLKEIFADYSKIISVQNQYIKRKRIYKKVNPYGFNFDEVSKNDIIKGAIESNVPVFIHDDYIDKIFKFKVEELDPDCEIINMRDVTSDNLNGKHDMPPTWYLKLKEKCYAYPNKIHIILFNEITNALSPIQDIASDIISKGVVNGKWKLPSNARIVAIEKGVLKRNTTSKMTELLLNTFLHVYVDWFSESTSSYKYIKLDYISDELETKIHPSIYAYFIYKIYNRCDEVLKTQYIKDKSNIDLRKWEMASKILFKTKQPEMLRNLIGEDLTKDFIAFAKQQVISIVGYKDLYKKISAYDPKIAKEYIEKIETVFTNNNYEYVYGFISKALVYIFLYDIDKYFKETDVDIDDYFEIKDGYEDIIKKISYLEKTKGLPPDIQLKIGEFNYEKYKMLYKLLYKSIQENHKLIELTDGDINKISTFLIKDLLSVDPNFKIEKSEINKENVEKLIKYIILVKDLLSVNLDFKLEKFEITEENLEKMNKYVIEYKNTKEKSKNYLLNINKKTKFMQKALEKLLFDKRELDLKDSDFTGLNLEFANLEGTKAIIDPQKVLNKSLKGTNLRGLNLLNADFTNVDIEGANLEYSRARINPQKVYRKSLIGTNLSSLILHYLDFTNVDIRFANFEGTKARIDPQEVLNKSLYGTNLKGLDLKDADFTDVDIEEANLEGTKAKIDPQEILNKSLYGTNLKGLDLKDADFTDVDIEEANLEGTQAKIDPQEILDKSLYGTNLKGLDLKNADFTDVNIKFANLEGTKAKIDPQKVYRKSLKGTNLKGLDLKDADFTDVNLEGANLEGTNAKIKLYKILNKSLKDTNLKGIDLEDVDFINIEGANLEGTNARIDPQEVLEKSLRGANLKGLDLKDADFIGVNLEGANLEGTNARIDPQEVLEKSLRGVNLRGLDLKDVDFTGVNVEGANLEGTGAKIDPQKVLGKSLRGANLKGLDLKDADFTDVNLECTSIDINEELIYKVLKMKK